MLYYKESARLHLRRFEPLPLTHSRLARRLVLAPRLELARRPPLRVHARAVVHRAAPGAPLQPLPPNHRAAGTRRTQAAAWSVVAV